MIIKDRTGEIRYNADGFKMEIIKYRNHKSVDIEITININGDEFKIIRNEVAYSQFNRGEIKVDIIIDDVTYKYCRVCETIKTLDEFNKSKIGRLGVEYRCRECEYQYRRANKDHIKSRDKLYYEENKEKVIETIKKYRDENKEKVNACGKRYREKNKSRKKEYDRTYRSKNKEKISTYRNGERYREIEFNMSSRRRYIEASGSGLQKGQWREMMEFFDWKCAYSGERLPKGFRSIDHVIPLSKGGEHEVWNLVPMYKNYNSSKSATLGMEAWYRKQPYFCEKRLKRIYEWIGYALNTYNTI